MSSCAKACDALAELTATANEFMARQANQIATELEPIDVPSLAAAKSDDAPCPSVKELHATQERIASLLAGLADADAKVPRN